MRAGVIVLAVGLVGTAAYLGWRQSQQPEPTVDEETELERGESIRAAFAPSVDPEAGSDVTGDPVLMKEAQQFFEDLGRAFAKADEKQIRRLFSAEATLSYLQRSDVIPTEKKGALRRDRFRRRFTKGLYAGMVINASVSAFSRAEVVRLEQIRDVEMVVYLRAQSIAFDVGVKMRWWLLKSREGHWQAYDYEDLDQGLRASTLMGALSLGSSGGKPPWSGAFIELAQAIRKLASPDPEGAFTAISSASERVLRHHPPRPIEGYALVMHASAASALGDYECALADLEKAERILGPTPIIHYTRGSALRDKGEPEQAIAEFGRYTEILGWDADIHEEFSDCHFSLGQMAQALEHAEKGLADNPQSTGCLASLAVSLPADRRSEITEHLEAFDDKEPAYETILGYASQIEAHDLIEHVLTLLKADLPKSALIQEYEGASEKDHG